PDLTVEPAQVTATTAHLFGAIDPNGGNTDPIVGVLPISWTPQYQLPPHPGGSETWLPAASGTVNTNPLGAPEATSGAPVQVDANASNLLRATACDKRFDAR